VLTFFELIVFSSSLRSCLPDFSEESSLRFSLFAFREVGLAVNFIFACASILFFALVSQALYPHLLMQTYNINNTQRKFL